MSLQRMCRECVIEAVLRRAIDAGAEADGSAGRVQLIVDGGTLRVLNSFLKMGELHAEGVTSMELIERAREPLPALDALYFVTPDGAAVDAILADFKDEANPQHRNVHLVFTRPVPDGLMARLAEAKTLAPRVKSFMEVPLSSLLIQDRGFHFDMLDSLPGFFPVAEGGLIDEVAHRLADACRCLQATSPIIRYAQGGACRAIAEQVQAQLQPHRAQDGQVPCQLLILDRSVDMTATLVHEYTYEAAAYDLLDYEGSLFDIERNVVTLKGPSVTAGEEASSREILLSDADPMWEELKHQHLEAAQQVAHAKVAEVRNATATTRNAGAISTGELLDTLRKAPEQRDTMDRLLLHMEMIEGIFRRIKDEALTSSFGLLEQDIACGIDKSGKDVKFSSLEANLGKLFNEPAIQLSSEAKLRVLMLFFSCFANIAEPVRQQLINRAQLGGEDQDVLMAMLSTKLMEVPESQRHKAGSGTTHRVTQEQAARFKQNARSDGRFELSRFEPRVKGLIEQLSQDRLSRADYPVLECSGAGARAGQDTPAVIGSATPAASPLRASADTWGFTSWGQAPGGGAAGKAGAAKEVSQRIVVFILGGVMHSELRAAAEVRQSLPRGTEVLLGGTAMLTPRRFMHTLRPRGGESGRAADDRLDLA